MDINQFLNTSQSRGLEAINAIRQSRATVTQDYFSKNPVVSLSRASVSGFTSPKVIPTVAPIKPKPTPVQIKQPEPIIQTEKSNLQQWDDLILGGYGQRVGYNFNRLTQDLGDYFQKELGPAITEFVRSSVSAGVPGTFNPGALPGTSGFSENLAREIQIAAKPEQAQQIRTAETRLGTTAGLFTAQVAGLPGEVLVQRSLVQPVFQNYKLDRAEKRGINITPEQRRLASLGDLNQDLNQIMNLNIIPITDTMSQAERLRAEQNNYEYYQNQLLDTVVSLIDLDTLAAVGLTTAALPKAAKSLRSAIRVENATESIKQISRLAVNGDKPGIEKIIKRKLTPEESAKIDSIKSNPLAKKAQKDIDKIQGTRPDVNLQEADAFEKQLELDREIALGKKKTFGEKVKNIWTNYKTLFESSNEEFVKVIDDIEKKVGELQPSKNPLMFLDVLYKTARQAENYAKNNGLVDILKKASNISPNRTPEQFGNLLFARRAVTLNDSGVRKLNNVDKYKNFIKVNEAKYKELLSEYDNYMKKLIDFAKNEGLISADEFERVSKLEDYTPFFKIFDVTEKPEPAVLTKRSIGTVTDPKIIQKLEDVENQIYQNPISSTLYYTYRVIDQANKNRFASRVGNLVREGLIEGGTIARDADNVLRRNNLLQDIAELKKVQDRVNNVLTKKKVQWKVIAKDLNALAKRGMYISLNMKDAPVDNAFLRRVEKKINDRLVKKQEILNEIDSLNEAGLDFAYVNLDNEQANRDLEITNKFTEKFTKKINAKLDEAEDLANQINDLNIEGLEIKLKSGRETLAGSNFNTKLRQSIQSKIIKKEELVEDILNSTDETVRNRLNKYLSTISGVKYTKKADRLAFYKSLTDEELEDLMYKIYDLNFDEYKKFKDKFKLVARNKARYGELVDDLDALKRREVTNELTNSIIQSTPKQLQQVQKLITKKNNKLKGVLTDIKDLSDARLTNFLTNKLIKSTPEELNAIKAAIKNKESELIKTIDEVENLSTNRYYNALVTSMVKKSPEDIEKINPILREIRKQNKQKASALEDVTNTILDAQKVKEQTTEGIQTRQAEEKLLRDADTTNQSTISWYRNGEKEVAIVPKSLADGLKVDTDQTIYDTAINVLNVPTRVWKDLTVGLDVVSQVRQYQKDQTAIAFFTIPRVGFSAFNPSVMAKALYGAVTESPEYLRFLELGGGGTSYDIYGGTQTVDKFIKKGAKTSKVSLKNLEKKLGKLEESARFQIYLGTKEAYLRKGYSLEDAEIKAIYDSNNLLPNYFQTGRFSKVLELAAPFTRAKIASARVLRREFAKNPKAVTLTLLVNYALPMGAITYWNMSSPERREAYEDIPEYEKERGLIIMPEVPTRNEEGKYEYVSIPVDESIFALVQGHRRATEAAMKTDEKSVANVFRNVFDEGGVNLPQTGSDILESATGQTVPLTKEQIRQQIASGNPAVLTPIQAVANRDLFLNTEIETSSDMGKLPKDRFDDKSSLLAKDLGQKYNVSPKMVDFFIEKYGSNVGRYMQFTLDTARTAAEGDPRTVVGKNPIQELERIIFRASGGAKERKIREQLTKEKQELGSTKVLIEEAYKNGDIEVIKELSNNITLQEMRAIENRIQTDAIRDNLVGPQKNLFNLSTSELDKVAEKYPEYQDDVNAIKELKKQINKTPNTNFAELGITFKSTGGGGVSAPKIARVKIGKVSKPRRVRLKAPAKPKKIKVAKPKQVKQVRLAKIKPLKKIKRI